MRRSSLNNLVVIILFSWTIQISESKFEKAKKDFGNGRDPAEIERTCEKIEKFKSLTLKNVAKKIGQQQPPKQNQKSNKTDRNEASGSLEFKEVLTIAQINKLAPAECVIGGDVIPTEQQMDQKLAKLDQEDEAEASGGRKKRGAAAIETTFHRWPKMPAYIPYYFDASIASTTRITIAKVLQYYADRTCLQFGENAAATQNKLRFIQGSSGCRSYVGMVGWASQDVFIGVGCEQFGTVAHEVGHALGFFHEQQRYDRDSYVTINYNNINSSEWHNFDKETTADNYNYGIQYDYGSIMHYDEDAFGLSSSAPTIYAVEVRFQHTMGNRNVPSFWDIKMLNLHYQCTCATQLPCKNSGYTNPANCSACICPDGFGGAYCDQPAPPTGSYGINCGGVISVNATSKTIDLSVGKLDNFDYKTQTTCWWWLYAPAGKKVEITIISGGDVATVSGGTTRGCYWGWTELKMGYWDWARTGYRLCNPEDYAGYPVYTSGNPSFPAGNNLAIIGLSSRYNIQRIKANVKAI